MGRSVAFAQDNHSLSGRNVLRGLHYQIPRPQAKLVRVLVGEVFDVAVDLRRSSPNFGQWASAILSADNKRQLWLPEGFAHGFLILSRQAEVLVKVSDYWAPEHGRCIRWNDATLAIKWPLQTEPILSAMDRQGVALEEADSFAYHPPTSRR